MNKLGNDTWRWKLFFLLWGAIILFLHVVYPSQKSSFWGVSTWFSTPYTWRIIILIISNSILILTWWKRKNIETRLSTFNSKKSKLVSILASDWVILPVLFVILYGLRTRVYYGDVNVNFHKGIYANFLTYQLYQVFTCLLSYFHWSSIKLIAIMSSFAGVIYFMGVRKLVQLLTGKENQFLPRLFLYTILPVQLFFGYVEVYFTLAAVLPWYFWSGILFLRNRKKFMFPTLWFGVVMLFHLSAGWLIFSYILLVIHLKTRFSFTGWVKQLIPACLILATMVVAVLGIIFLTVYETNFDKFMWDYTHVKEERTFKSLSGGGDQKMFVPVSGGSYNLFSMDHLGYFLNEIVFLSPMVIPLFLFGFKLPSRREDLPVFGFLLTAAAGFFIFTFTWNPDFGFPMDWDLFANSGIVLSIAFVCMVTITRKKQVIIPLLIAININFFHAVPWIISNAEGIGKGQNKVLISMENPVSLTRYTVLRDYLVPFGKPKLEIPLKYVHDINKLKFQSRFIPRTVSIKPHDPCYVVIIIEHDEGKPIKLEQNFRYVPGKKVYHINFDNKFKYLIQPTKITLYLQCLPVYNWKIGFLELSQPSGRKAYLRK